MNLLSAGAPADQTLLATQGLWEIARGETTVEAWLKSFGHRAPEEFDLSTPRWRERPDAVEAMASHLAEAESPVERHRQKAGAAEDRAGELERSLPRTPALEFRRKLELAHRYVRFREDGKFHLMLAYDLLRDLALEAGRRLEIGPDVFLLGEEELHDALLTVIAPLHQLERRRLKRAAEAGIELPSLIGEEQLGGLGEAPELTAAGGQSAFPISNGIASGPARIVMTPEEAGDPGSGYILVCPSTDPNWTPLFAKAAGLVIERGGMLSHGAVVAREMGIPAVVAEGATRFLDDGDMVTVDGNRGSLVRNSPDDEGSEGTSPQGDRRPDPDDMRIPAAMTPPVPGAVERRNARWRNRSLGGWALFFLAVFLLPRRGCTIR